MLFVGLPVVGLEASPFGPGFAPAHFLPHLLGMLILIVCLFLAYGNDYKGVWSFGVVPDSAFRPFARASLRPVASGSMFRFAHAEDE